MPEGLPTCSTSSPQDLTHPEFISRRGPLLHATPASGVHLMTVAERPLWRSSSSGIPFPGREFCFDLSLTFWKACKRALPECPCAPLSETGIPLPPEFPVCVVVLCPTCSDLIWCFWVIAQGWETQCQERNEGTFNAFLKSEVALRFYGWHISRLLFFDFGESALNKKKTTLIHSVCLCRILFFLMEKYIQN